MNSKNWKCYNKKYVVYNLVKNRWELWEYVSFKTGRGGQIGKFIGEFSSEEELKLYCKKTKKTLIKNEMI